MSLYVTLPSNVIEAEFPDNSNSKYTVRLTKPLVFAAAEWEVGLAELHFPNKWENVTVGEITIIDSGEKTVIHLTQGSYKSLEQLLVEIARRLNVNNYDKTVYVYEDEVKNRVMLMILDDETSVSFSRDLAIMLGGRANKLYGEGVTTFRRRPDIDQGLHSLYIYSDVAETRPVGNTMAALLRVVPFKNHQTATHAEFRNVQYIPVANTRTDLVSVLIRRDDGEPVPFEDGKVVATLHFRKI